MEHVVKTIPPRPLSHLMHPTRTEDRDLTKEFLNVLRETRKGERDPDSVNWVKYKLVLLQCQGSGRTPHTVLRQRPRALPFPPHLEPYVAFLELEREDLIWTSRYQVLSLGLWLKSLGNKTLLQKAKPLFGGTLDLVESWISEWEERQDRNRRRRNARRKAKSRKNLQKIM